VKRADEWEGTLTEFLKDCRYQRELTAHLDGLGPQPFAQDVVNEIVLWKVNRYAKLSPDAIEALNRVAEAKPKSHRAAEAAVATLLRAQGVDLPMASTLLRFRNRKAFQIIDRHAYRAVYGEDYPLYSSSSDDAKIDLYFGYLDRLFGLADSRSVEFESLDRVLYVFDKQVNGKL
jgi:thermostable 8-oxoguanine DNA glycosylase